MHACYRAACDDSVPLYPDRFSLKPPGTTLPTLASEPARMSTSSPFLSPFAGFRTLESQPQQQPQQLQQQSQAQQAPPQQPQSRPSSLPAMLNLMPSTPGGGSLLLSPIAGHTSSLQPAHLSSLRSRMCLPALLLRQRRRCEPTRTSLSSPPSIFSRIPFVD
jgi:hypothetical protein